MKKFHNDDLKLCDFQYMIRHNNTKLFKCGEQVFLKSNPECPMIVHIINNKITTIWYDNNNELQTAIFPPQCLLQYKYAGLLIYKRSEIKISLN